MIVTQPADLLSDRKVIVETLRYLTDQSNQQRFEWFYTASPEGRARAWLAKEEASGTVVGTAAAFPRRFYIGGKEILGWVLGDFCFAPQYRSLGPALKLQRACLDILEQDQQTFCYDFPSASMVGVHRRMGFNTTGKMVRLVMPLRVDGKVKTMIKNPAVQRVASSVGNAFLKLWLSKMQTDKNLEVAVQNTSCGEEFTLLAEEQHRNFELSLKRSAEYLNWRYVKNPLTMYEIITARRHGKLKGYAVWTRAGEAASVVDLFGENNREIVKALIAAVIVRLKNLDVATLSLWLSDSHPWMSWCSEIGFRARDTVPMVCVPGAAFSSSVDVRNTKWFLMQGDRDS